MDLHLRRRVAVAAVFTAVAVPFAVLVDGGTDTATDQAGATTPTVDAELFPTSSTALPVPVFLDNPAVIVPPAVIDIARPDGDAPNRLFGRAGFRTYPDTNAAVCTVRLAPADALLTVTNVDTGLSVTCLNLMSGYVPAGVDVVLATSVFTVIGDVVSAPIPVEVRW